MSDAESRPVRTVADFIDKYGTDSVSWFVEKAVRDAGHDDFCQVCREVFSMMADLRTALRDHARGLDLRGKEGA